MVLWVLVAFLSVHYALFRHFANILNSLLQGRPENEAQSTNKAKIETRRVTNMLFNYHTHTSMNLQKYSQCKYDSTR